MRFTLLSAMFVAFAVSAPLCSAGKTGFHKPLIQQLKSPYAPDRLAAAKRIGRYGVAANAAIPALSVVMSRDKDGRVANQAAASLAQIGEAAVPELIRAMEGELSIVRWRALWALGQMGPAAHRAVPQLQVILQRDVDPRYRAMAAQALGEIGIKAADVVPALCHAAQDVNAAVRQQAMIAIANLGKCAVPAVQKMLKDNYPDTRILALEACRLLGKNAAAALPDLTTILQNDEPPLRAMAAAAVAEIGTPAKKAIPTLLERLRDKHYPTQRHALAAMYAIGLNDFPGLMDQLSKINQEVEWAAPIILSQFGKKAKDAVPHLIKGLSSDKVGVRLGSANALERLGVDATAAVPELQKRLTDANPMVRASVLTALNAIYRDQPVVVQKRIANAKQQLATEIIQVAKRFDDLGAGKTQNPSNQLLSTNRLLLQNPVRQAEHFRVVELHLIGSKKNSIVPPTIRQTNSIIVNRFGPEGVPALVHGINTAAIYQMGFC